MENHTVYVGTVTYAMKGRDLLNKLGYKARVERRTKDIGKYGCGYSIAVTGGTKETIATALGSAGIKILNIE